MKNPPAGCEKTEKRFKTGGGLAPLRCKAKAHANKGETDNHVPGANAWDRIASLAYIEDHDPDQTDKEISNHHRSEPFWALRW